MGYGQQRVNCRDNEISTRQQFPLREISHLQSFNQARNEDT